MDETGHSGDTSYVGMAGLVAPSSRWVVFENDWKVTMEKAGIEYFHMREFAHSTGQFKEWKGKEEQRRLLLSRLMQIIRGTDATPVGAIVSMADYRTLTELQRGQILDPYYLCFQTCAWGAVVMAIFEPPEEEVVMIFGQHNEFQGRAAELWKVMRENINHGERMGSYAFSNAREVVPLQAADIVAYELFQEFDNRLKRPHLKRRWPFKQFLSMRPVPLFRYFDRKELLQVVEEFPLSESPI